MENLNKRGFSVVEYVVLFVIIIGAFLIMRNNIQRGIYGLWAQSGQSFAFGRQYDPQKTVECGFDDQNNLWYDHNCVESHCPNGDSTCQESIITGGSCASSYCSQLN